MKQVHILCLESKPLNGEERWNKYQTLKKRRGGGKRKKKKDRTFRLMLFNGLHGNGRGAESSLS